METQEQPSASQDEVSDPRSSLQEISNAMVRLYKELFGRGPTKARSHFCGPDTLLCVLENTLTPAERSLIELGKIDGVRDTRTLFQYGTEDQFVKAVEDITGRRVRSFVSGMDARKDVATETFLFESETDTGDLDDGRPAG